MNPIYEKSMKHITQARWNSSGSPHACLVVVARVAIAVRGAAVGGVVLVIDDVCR